MNRRSFLASLLATAALDPERLLWVPGKKAIFIPPVAAPKLEHLATAYYKRFALDSVNRNFRFNAWSAESFEIRKGQTVQWYRYEFEEVV